jgi:hypothetical protein
MFDDSSPADDFLLADNDLRAHSKKAGLRVRVKTY